MGTAQFILRAFRLALVLSIIMLLVGCGGHKTGKNKASAEGSEEIPTESLKAKIVTNDIINSTGTNGEPLAYITIKKGDYINLKGDVSGGYPPYTYNWNFDDVKPDVTVKDPGNIEFMNVTGSNYGVTYTVEFTVTDKNGNQSVDSLDVVVFHD
jgi:hypothetical protein